VIDFAKYRQRVIEGHVFDETFTEQVLAKPK